MLALGFGFWSEWELQEKVDFDGINKIITVYPHVTTLDIREDVWSAWVRWDAMLARNYNRFDPAMERTGLESIPGSEPTGDFYFLINGWKLVIDLTAVAVTGVLYSRDFLTAYYDSELKPQFPIKVSSIVNVVTGSPVITGDIADVPDAVWGDTVERAEESKGGLVDHLRHLQYSLVFNSTYSPVDEIPDGSQHRPFNDVSTLIDYAEDHKIKNIFLYSELIPELGRSIKNFVLTGIGLQKVVLEGQDLSKSEFNHIELEGQYLGRIIAESCLMTGVNTTLNGEFGNCTLGSTFEVPDGGSALIQHSSSIADGFVKPTFSIGGVAGTARLEFAGHVGGITIINCNQPTDDVKIIGNGIVELDSSCQDGDIVIVGTIKPIDNSGPNCNVQWLNLDPTKLSNIPADVWNHTQ